MTTSPILTTDGLRKNYGSTVALGGVDMSVAAGESLALMGPSGSGKSTLLHCLAGIDVPDSGRVRWNDHGTWVRVDELSERERSRLRREDFGFVFQQGLLIPELTAVENVALALMVSGVSRRDAEPRAAQALAGLGLAGLEERRIGQLSGGQAQRVAIARAQVTEAEIVFADEPTGALDSVTSDEVLTALLQATVDRGRTLVVVTHDEAVAARCSRTVRLRDGVVEQVSEVAA